jgi:phage shock protein PspC (stress-responsive transcriptional regulator)
MQNIKSSLIARSDTLFGVCEALGTDFGISPNWLRIAFAAAVIYNLEYAIGAYLAVGLVVAITRFFYPSPRPAAVAPAGPAETVADAPELEAVVTHAEPVAQAA